MDRLLIVPAAGRGSRLGGGSPKALLPVAGRPMLDHLLRLHAPFVDAAVVVVAPAARPAFEAYAARAPLSLDLVVQQEPTGMLDALLDARAAIGRRHPARVAVTWCDQIAITQETARTLDEIARHDGAPDLVFPTFVCDRPYIHLERDEDGRIVAVRHRREGDDMPARGETDMGLFDLAEEAFSRRLEEFAATAPSGRATRERNFLPFIPWLAARARVDTFPGRDIMETIGINTPEELAAIETHLRRRAPVV